MGVPVIALRGDRHAARVGATLLQAVGLADWVADDEDAYVERAVRAAMDRSALGELRRALRPAMARSALCDADGFARSFEMALRRMWDGYCTGAERTSGPR